MSIIYKNLKDLKTTFEIVHPSYNVRVLGMTFLFDYFTCAYNVPKRDILEK